MSTHLDQTYSLKNLRRAWLYVKTNPEAFYKSYFRPQYDAFAAVRISEHRDHPFRGIVITQIGAS